MLRKMLSRPEGSNYREATVKPYGRLIIGITRTGTFPQVFLASIFGLGRICTKYTLMVDLCSILTMSSRRFRQRWIDSQAERASTIYRTTKCRHSGINRAETGIGLASRVIIHHVLWLK